MTDHTGHPPTHLPEYESWAIRMMGSQMIEIGNRLKAALEREDGWRIHLEAAQREIAMLRQVHGYFSFASHVVAGVMDLDRWKGFDHDELAMIRNAIGRDWESLSFIGYPRWLAMAKELETILEPHSAHGAITPPTEAP